jgi:hypothetical protein
MITTFEVGAVFKIINDASPALAEILKQVRALNKAMTTAREGMASLGVSISSLRLGAAVGETDALAASWDLVAKNAAAARLAMGQAARMPPIGGGIAAAGGRGGNHRPGWLGGGAHISGPSASLPGGSHVRMGGGAMAAAGLLGYGVYEASEIQDAVWEMIFHSKLKNNEENQGKFRKILQDAMKSSGFSLHDISQSALAQIRMFQGTPGGGLDVLPEMLQGATTEARLKENTSPEAAMKAYIGLAHMVPEYGTEAIKKLMVPFAFLSTANPSSLASMERAASYAVPLLKSGLGIDPMDTMLLGTALTRAGATNTKSGTWLREMALRAMPGTSLMSKLAYKKHEEALKAFGLEGDDGKPTWFDQSGKPDIFKMLDIAGKRAGSIPLDKRAAYERSLFGAQGGGGFAMLADPAVNEQIKSLREKMNSPEWKNQYQTFAQSFTEGSTPQAARTAIAEFNVTMQDLGISTLPTVNLMLKDFKSTLEAIRSVLPGGTGNSGAQVLARVGEGAGAGFLTGAAVGAFGGPFGALAGGIGGGVIGGVGGIAEAYMKNGHTSAVQEELKNILKRGPEIGGVVGGIAEAYMKNGHTAAVQEELKNILKRGPEIGAQKPLPTPATPITLNLNINGTALGQALGVIGANSFDGQAPAFDGLGEHQGGAAQHSDK